MSTVLITGANRGIGLALAQLYRQRGWDVIAVCRAPSAELSDIGAEIISSIDVTDAVSLKTLVAALSGKTLDLVINNAGVFEREDLGSIDYNQIMYQLEVNAIAPLRVTEALLPLMAKGASVAVITSRMGSMGDNGSGSYYGYRMSKAALNAAAVSLARDLKPRGIKVAILHPGFVQTAMVNFGGDVTPAQSAAGLAARIDGLTLENSGSFWHANGEVLPW